MQLKMQTDYAIRILLYLASADGRVNMQELSDNLGIKKTNIPRTLALLRKAGLIASESGINGGFQLVQPPFSITLLDVMKVSEDSVKINRCLGKDEFCSRNGVGHCPVHGIYAGYQEMAEWYFKNVTIADLLEQDAVLKIRTKHMVCLKQLIG